MSFVRWNRSLLIGRPSGALAVGTVKAYVSNLDLFETFRANDPASLFFKGRNDHWNDRGQDLAAEATALHLQETRPDRLDEWRSRE